MLRKRSLWGDSFAEAMWPGLDKVLSRTGLGGVTVHKAGCPPVLEMSIEGTSCRSELIKEMFDAILGRSDIKYVIVYGNFTRVFKSDAITISGAIDKRIGLEKSFNTVANFLNKYGKKLILIEEGPNFSKDVTRNIVFNFRTGLLGAEVINKFDFQEHVSNLQFLKNLVDTYVSTEDFFCKEDICPSVDENGKMVIYDQTHLTIEYACLLSKYVFEKVDGLPDASSVNCDENTF